MHESLHVLKSQGFALLAHDIFDLFHQTRVVLVSEDTVIPACLNHKMVELNIVLDDMLIILHLQVVNPVFSIGGRINQTKLGTESSDEGRPIVHPCIKKITFVSRMSWDVLGHTRALKTTIYLGCPEGKVPLFFSPQGVQGI